MIERLSFLIGRLSGPEQVHATSWASAGVAQGRVDARLELDGRIVVQHQTQARPGVAGFTSLNVFMVDPTTQEILLYGFDSVGFPADPPARGRWHDEDLVFDRVTPRGASRTTYTPTRAGYRWIKEFQAPGDEGWTAVVEGEMTRDGG
jgi:hypothetical protein